VIVRRETASDVEVARAVQAAAFAAEAGVEPPEARLLDELRADEDWLPALSLVAVSGGEVIGHVACSRAHVGDVPVVALGPIGVRPDAQLTGIGSALVHAVLGAAEALGEPLVGLLGSPAYYGRFGFVAASDVGIEAPDPAWGEHFQVRAFVPPAAVPRGRFRYATPFDRL
jgi:putative acetyltransferase